MKYLVLILLLSFVPSAASYSNDCSVSGQGGRWKVLKGEHNSVQMVSETVSISVLQNSSNENNGFNYKTIATFIFKNHGKAQTVKMGFPESSYGDFKGGFLYFHTWVDGKEVKAERCILDPEDEDSSSYVAFNPDSIDCENGFEALWIKEVSFEENETKTITVEYMSPVNSGVALSGKGIEYWISYDFTGGNWYGTVEESKVIAEIPSKFRLIASGIFDSSEEKKFSGFKKTTQNKINILTASVKNWQAEGILNIKFK